MIFGTNWPANWPQNFIFTFHVKFALSPFDPPNFWSHHGPGGGGVGLLRFELDRGVPLEPQNPYPSLRVILAEKGTHF